MAARLRRRIFDRRFVALILVEVIAAVIVRLVTALF